MPSAPPEPTASVEPCGVPPPHSATDAQAGEVAENASPAAITLHSKSDCSYCDRAREWLAANAIPFTEIKHDDPADRADLYGRLAIFPDRRTMPQIVLRVDGEDMLIGGYGGLMREAAGLLSLFAGGKS